MKDFGERVQDAITRHGIVAVAYQCGTSLIILKRWADGHPPYGTAQAAVLKALDAMGGVQ